MNKIKTLFLASLLLAATAKGEKPNIIFILTDDLGFNQIGAYGNTPIKTPNLDKMAANGILFSQAYSGSTVCSPSRVSLFTGRDGRILKDNSNSAQLDQLDITMATVLKHGGYDTALFGKYSIGYQMGITDPLAMGFDTWFGMYGILEGHRQYPTFLWRDGKKIRIKENEGGKKNVYAQEAFTEETIKYVSQDRESPFFVMLAYSSPHAELAVPEKYLEPYLGKFEEVPYLGMFTEKDRDKFAWYYPEKVEHPYATTAGMITALDDYVGQIQAALEKKGIADNTLIFFTSDNGPHKEGGASPEYFKASAPYKGMKRDLYDGGIHVPMIAHWPAAVSKARIDETPWTFADVLPTLAELAEVDLREIPRVLTNGDSIAGLLKNEPEAMPERTLYWEFGEFIGDPNSGVVGEIYQAARRGKWKAVRYGLKSPIELYDLDSDPGESKELSATEVEIFAEFTDLFEKYAD